MLILYQKLYMTDEIFLDLTPPLKPWLRHCAAQDDGARTGPLEVGN